MQHIYMETLKLSDSHLSFTGYKLQYNLQQNTKHFFQENAFKNLVGRLVQARCIEWTMQCVDNMQEQHLLGNEFYFDGLVQNWSNDSALAMELLQYRLLIFITKQKQLVFEHTRQVMLDFRQLHLRLRLA